MRYLYRRGPGASRRVMHLSHHDSRGRIDRTQCGRTDWDTSINMPWGLGRPVCKRCRAAVAS